MCFSYANMKDAVAGLLQIPIDAMHDGAGQRGFDGYPMVIKLVNDRARTCRIDARIKLVDKMMNTYEVFPPKRSSECLLLLELTSKTAILRDRRGACSNVLCGGEIELNGYTMKFDPTRRACMKPPEPTESP